MVLNLLSKQLEKITELREKTNWENVVGYMKNGKNINFIGITKNLVVFWKKFKYKDWTFWRKPCRLICKYRRNSWFKRTIWSSSIVLWKKFKNLDWIFWRKSCKMLKYIRTNRRNSVFISTIWSSSTILWKKFKNQDWKFWRKPYRMFKYMLIYEEFWFQKENMIKLCNIMIEV